MLTNIIKDLKELKATRQKEEVLLLPSALRIAKALEELEVNQKLSKKIIKAWEDEDSSLEYDGKQSFNSYNWNGSIDHHMQGHVVKYNGKKYLLLSFHRFGDVRVNYTEKAVFPHESEEDVIDFQEAIVYNADVNFKLSIKHNEFFLRLSPFYDGVEAESDFLTVTFFPDGYTIQEIIESLINKLKEEGVEVSSVEEVLKDNEAVIKFLRGV